MTDDRVARVRAVLATTPLRWRHLTATVPLPLLEAPAAPGEWSAIACLRHLLGTEREVFPVRVRAILHGENLTNWDPDEHSDSHDQRTPGQLAEEFAARRAASLAALDQLAVADLERTAQHSELGSVTLGEMLHEWAAHDLNHTIQAERALMQPFIAGCGSWRESFADHDFARATPS